MADISREEMLQAVRRHLETDLLLGVDAAPIRLTGVSPRAAESRPTFPRGGPGSVSGGSAGEPSRRATAPPVAAGRTPAEAGACASGTRLKTAVFSGIVRPGMVQAVPPEQLEERRQALAQLDQQQVRTCDKCALSRTRTHTVFGQGHPAARLVFVGEAPGADEDASGLAFVGRAGELLTRMIEAMGLTRDEVFICNILKCRPPDNRDPAPDEIAACWPYLDRQLQIISPEVIVALGRPAAQTLLRTRVSIGELRGQWHDYYVSGSPMVGKPTPLMPTYHPAYLLRNPADKAKCWSDLQQVMARLGLKLPRRDR